MLGAKNQLKFYFFFPLAKKKCFQRHHILKNIANELTSHRERKPFDCGAGFQSSEKAEDWAMVLATTYKFRSFIY